MTSAVYHSLWTSIEVVIEVLADDVSVSNADIVLFALVSKYQARTRSVRLGLKLRLDSFRVFSSLLNATCAIVSPYLLFILNATQNFITMTSVFCSYNGDLNTELVRYSNGSKLFDRWMVPYSDHHLNNELKVRYSGHGLNNELIFCYSNGRNLFWNLSRNLSFSLGCFIYKNNFYS